MAFKSKTKNRLLLDERQTLDAKHNNILQSFADNKNSISILHEELINLNKIINELQIKNAQSPFLNITLQKQIWDYDDKKKLLEDEIRRIENNIDEDEYMLKTGKLLCNYYKIVDYEKNIADNGNLNLDLNMNLNINTGLNLDVKSILKDSLNEKSTKKNIIKQNIVKKKNIIDWFQPVSGENIFDNLDKEQLINNTNINSTYNSNSNTNIIQNNSNTNIIQNNSNIIQTNSVNQDGNKKYNKYIQKDETIIIQNKDTIYEKYMKMIDKNYININNENVDIFDSCPKCSVEMLLNNNTGQLICPKCGIMENIIVDSDKPSFKEPPKEMTSFCYKRINHLNEFLAQFQAKETTDIPEDVYNEILIEIKKERITNMVKITPEKMRILLKKIKKNDYYEHIPYIINQLNGLPAPVIAPEIEEIIRGMFKAIQIPFEKYCPFKRKNFLSYNYVMYKFFELLELDEYLKCFQLLKSRTKLHQQDEIWKNICKDLNWECIKSL
jgi:hypothetical protein